MKKILFIISFCVLALDARAQFNFPIDDIFQFMNGCQLFEIETPDTPEEGYGHLYILDDNHIYFKNDLGEEYDLTAGTTGTVPSSRTLEINGTSYDLTANRTWTVGNMVAANNLSDLLSISTARTNLGLGSAALQNTSAFLQPGNNLSDVTTPSTARTNLGLGSIALLSVISESNFSFTDITTANTSTSAHGLVPKLPNDQTKYFNGVGNYATPVAWIGACVGGSSVTASTTQYAPIAGQNNFNSTEAARQFVMPVAGTLKNLYVVTGTNQPASGSIVITVRENGVDQALTLTVAANATANTFSDVTHSFAFDAGALISIKFVNNATGGSANIISWSAEIVN